MEARVEERRSSRSRWLVWAGAVALWLVLALKLDDDASGSEQAGFVVGGWVATLALALAIRALYWVIRGRKVPFWAPWIFVIAAAIGLVLKLGDIGEATERSEQAERIAARSPGEESKQVRDCIEGGVAGYQDASAKERAALPRDAYEELIGRACKEYERRGLFDRGELDRAELTRITEEIVAEMRAEGELPPA